MKRLAWLVLTATACFSPERALEGGGPPLGYETNVRACDDGRDNDRDGLVDCFDPDCIARNFCGEQIFEDDITEPEDTLLRCIDRIDNDRDGQFDCGDRGCQAIAELCCAVEFSDALCSNYLDDDGNNFADCQDFGCRNGQFVTVCDSEATFPPRRPGEDTCADGLDNDGDGRIDCNDDQCAARPVCCTGPTCDETTEGTLATCTDGLDNDGNGFTDCADFACSRMGTPEAQAFCASLPAEDTVEACSNGIDDDGNGFTDCGDFACSRSDDPNVRAVCENLPSENTAELCSNGVDEDGNGFVDCADFSCSRSCSLDVVAVCRGEAGREGGSENTFLTCIDRVDQDDNGFADCADFSCSQVSLVTPDECTQDEWAEVLAAFDLRLVDLDELSGDGIDRFPPGDLDGDGVPEDFDGDGAPGAVSPFYANPCDESRGPSDPADLAQLQNALTEAVARCSDGIDEDLDGFVDCDDWDCQWNPVLNPQASDRFPFDRVQGETGFCQGGAWEPSGGAIVWTQDPNREGTPGRSIPRSERRLLLCR
ncbi:MAG: hypothetical protein AAF447_19410 [Myxococcota bacterium]